MGKPEGKGPLGRPRRIWEDNIKIQEVGGGGYRTIILSGNYCLSLPAMQVASWLSGLVNTINKLQAVATDCLIK